MAKMEEKNKKFVALAAIDPYVVDNIINNTEKEIRGQEYIQYGDKNIYPNYVYNLYENVSILRSIVNGVADYVVGDGVKSNILTMSDEEAEDIVRNMAMSYAIFGSVALNVLRNRIGGIAKVMPLDVRNVRSDKKNENFWYSTEWAEKSYGRVKATQYPAYEKDSNVASSIYYFKNGLYSTYGHPIWASATEACEVEKLINEFHLNSLKNGFSSNLIVSFCNGVPADEIREEIEENFSEKFTSVENAGRPLINFCDDKEHSVDIQKIDVNNFNDRYTNLTKRCQQEIFTAWRANPNLFGIPTEGKGFSNEEYDESFKLFNRTVIRPIQKKIVNIFSKIYGEDVIEIKPFSIAWDDEDNKDEETVD